MPESPSTLALHDRGDGTPVGAANLAGQERRRSFAQEGSGHYVIHGSLLAAAAGMLEGGAKRLDSEGVDLGVHDEEPTRRELSSPRDDPCTRAFGQDFRGVDPSPVTVNRQQALSGRYTPNAALVRQSIHQKPGGGVAESILGSAGRRIRIRVSYQQALGVHAPQDTKDRASGSAHSGRSLVCRLPAS